MLKRVYIYKEKRGKIIRHTCRSGKLHGDGEMDKLDIIFGLCDFILFYFFKKWNSYHLQLLKCVEYLTVRFDREK